MCLCPHEAVAVRFLHPWPWGEGEATVKKRDDREYGSGQSLNRGTAQTGQPRVGLMQHLTKDIETRGKFQTAFAGFGYYLYETIKFDSILESAAVKKTSWRGPLQSELFPPKSNDWMAGF